MEKTKNKNEPFYALKMDVEIRKQVGALFNFHQQSHAERDIENGWREHEQINKIPVLVGMLSALLIRDERLFKAATNLCYRIFSKDYQKYEDGKNGSTAQAV